MSRRRAVAELVLAALAAVGAVVSWRAAISEVVVAPVLAGEPSTVSQAYYAPMLTLSLLLVTAAGVLAVLGVVGLRRAGSAANVHSL
jgi:hypothetical protein